MASNYTPKNPPKNYFLKNNGKGMNLKCLDYVYFRKQANQTGYNYE
jgi:hypothetical protein